MKTFSKNLTPLQLSLLSAYKDNSRLSLGRLAKLLNTSKSSVQRARDSLLARELIAVGEWKNREAGKPPVAAKVRVLKKTATSIPL